jgi:FixJ family two-component response regulator
MKLAVKTIMEAEPPGFVFPHPTVFVVDDDAAVRRSLVRLLKSAGYRAESFASADAFIECRRRSPLPGCALVDIQMPGIDGLQLQRELINSTHEIPIIFITGHGDIPSSVKAMKAGAVDFFSKPFNDEELLRAIREAIQRDHRLRSERAERVSWAARFATLTPREREVLEWVVAGKLNKQIAAALGASEKTIKIHRARVMKKMKVPSIADLVRAAEKIGMPPGSPPPPDR